MSVCYQPLVQCKYLELVHCDKMQVVPFVKSNQSDPFTANLTVTSSHKLEAIRSETEVKHKSPPYDNSQHRTEKFVLLGFRTYWHKAKKKE